MCSLRDSPFHHAVTGCNSRLKYLLAVLQVDPIRLSIFSNRFMSIAEQMGRVLQRTAISTNIKVWEQV